MRPPSVASSVFVWTEFGDKVHLARFQGEATRTFCGRPATELAQATVVLFHWPPCLTCQQALGVDPQDLVRG